MILRNISSRSITLKDSLGNQYVVSAYGTLQVSDDLWIDQTFKTNLRYQIRNIVPIAEVGFSAFKDPVKAGTTANITLSGTQTIDGIAVVADDRVLVKNQNTPSENGLYLVKSGAWVRTNDDIEPNLLVSVEEGTVNSDTTWVLTTDPPITVGVTSLTFVQFVGFQNITASQPLTKSGNTLGISLDNSTVENNAGVLRVKPLGITDASIAAANKDGAAGTASLRTLGTGATQAAAGNDSRLSDSRTPTAHQSTHQSGNSDALSGNLDATARVSVAKGASVTGARREINFIEGTNVSITTADDAGNEKVDVTIATAELPWIVNVNVFAPAFSNVNWNTLSQNSTAYLGGANGSSGAQNDEIVWNVVLGAGTWDVKVMGYNAPTSGIISVQFDGVEKGTIDQYAGAGTWNNAGAVNSISVPTTKKIALKLKMTSKNASSSNYYGYLQYLTLQRTA